MKHLGRKLFHVLGGLGLLGISLLFLRPTAFLVYALILFVALLFDTARLAVPRFNAFAMRHFSAFLRPAEARRLSGTPAYVAGVALTFLLFPKPVATAAVLFLVVGDVSATAVGERWGRTKVGDKSLEGTAAFLAAALAAGFLVRALMQAPAAPALIAGAATAALTELVMPRWANDNLVIPLVAAGVMTLLSPTVGS